MDSMTEELLMSALNGSRTVRPSRLLRQVLAELLRGRREEGGDDEGEEAGEGGREEERRLVRLLIGGSMLRRRRLRDLAIAQLLRE
jgi:hypothetical protein